MLDIEKVFEILGGLTLLKFFPTEPAARVELAKLVGQMATTHEQVEWLVARTIALCNEWPGPRTLRQIFCSKFKPRDGIEAGPTEIFPEGVPSERPIQSSVRPALPPGMEKEVAALAAAKSLELVPYEEPPDYAHLEELRRARLRRQHREIMQEMGLKPITQEDIDRAVVEARAKKNRSETS
jgi:hypothetical protein